MANLWDPVVHYDNTNSAYWEEQTYIADTLLSPLAPAGVTGSIMECHFGRQVASTVREDYAMFRLCMTVEAGPGVPMSRLDATDAARVETAWLGDFPVSTGPYVANDWALKEIAWRHFGADFPVDKNGVSKASPYWRITPLNVAGTSTSARLPDQVALTATFRTASRKHWGRIYAGGWASNVLNDSEFGHAIDACVDAMALPLWGFFKNIYDDTRKTYPVVWSAAHRGALTINELSVDDTFDVIRSRRAKFPTYRKTYTS